MGQLTVSVSAIGVRVLVSVAGEADMTVTGQLSEPLVAAVLAGSRNLVVDLSGLSFIDAACVRVLGGVCETAKEAGGTFMLKGPQPIVVRMLKLCGADGLLSADRSTAPASRPVPPAREVAVPRPRSDHEYFAGAG